MKGLRRFLGAVWDAMRHGHTAATLPPPICADTGAPKWPGNCWNVRCQLGGTCCRTSGVKACGADQQEKRDA
jgi:hypothetical protein